MSKEKANKTVEIPIRKNILKKLKENLPSGYFNELNNKLKDKGYDYTRQYIYQVLDPDNPRYNVVIIDTAIELMNELVLIREQKENRILDLVK